MDKTENYNFNEPYKFNSANISFKIPIFSERINTKNERYHVSNFNFILNDMKDENFEEKEKEKEEEKKKEEAFMQIPEKKEEFIDIEVNNDYLLSNNNENDIKFLGKKTKLEAVQEKDEIEENISKLKVLKLIDSYSYQTIFILLYKNFLSNKPEKDSLNNYNETANQQILKLVQEMGLNKVLSFVLTIGKSRGEKIKLCFECKEDDEVDTNENENEKDLQDDNKSLINFAKMLENDDIKEIINKNRLDNENKDKNNLKEIARSKLIKFLNDYSSRYNNE